MSDFMDELLFGMPGALGEPKRPPEPPARLRVGFTGTREGMTSMQKIVFARLIEEGQPFQFHHGDCVGADADAQGIVLAQKHTGRLECEITSHPPERDKFRAFTKHNDKSRQPLPYIERDRNIVNGSDLLIGCPKGPEPEDVLSSGTWTTIAYCRSTGRAVWIIHPSGEVEHEEAAAAVIPLFPEA